VVKPPIAVHDRRRRQPAMQVIPARKHFFDDGVSVLLKKKN
jgi:hypothetical protein